MGEVYVLEHPLVQHKVSKLRDKNTGVKEFRELTNELAFMLAYEATRDLPLQEIEVETPVAVAKTKVVSGPHLGVVPILRAGVGMLDGALNLVPSAKVGVIGLYRDPDTKLPVEYYCKLPEDTDKRLLLIVDPMLATGGSAVDAISLLKKNGAKNIRFLCIIAAPEGLAAVQKEHPDVDIYVAAVDEALNDHAYIVPGLGDAGDRIFGTK